MAIRPFKVQHWLQTQATKQPPISEMAAIVGLEWRTFLRRFQKATGLKPTEYSQRLRVGKAREMLEFTSQTVDYIGRTIGYEDPGSFRKVFHRVTGLAPSDYRRRFSVISQPPNGNTASHKREERQAHGICWGSRTCAASTTRVRRSSATTKRRTDDATPRAACTRDPAYRDLLFTGRRGKRCFPYALHQ